MHGARCTHAQIKRNAETMRTFSVVNYLKFIRYPNVSLQLNYECGIQFGDDGSVGSATRNNDDVADEKSALRDVK